ncbi:thiamine phosphate synthase [Anaerosinus sp.]|uniref:thiamine phosphate synthase n=1 Tax=Selenobaculum sp. TaxID=3074374 RepID=UPI003AB7F5C2
MNKEIAIENFLTTKIYALTAEKLSKGKTNLEVVAACIEAGIKFIQYREKTKKTKAMYEECLAIREITKRAGVTFVVNDYIDLALAVKADGVHVGQEDFPPQIVRKLIGKDMILGLSTHNSKQIEEAEKCGVVDYIGVGPVFATQTKTDVCAAVGLTYVEYAAMHSRLPFVAIGGIKEHNICNVAKAGAKTIAVVSDIVGAENIVEKIQKLSQQMKIEM